MSRVLVRTPSAESITHFLSLGKVTLVKRLACTEYSYQLTFRDLSRSDEVRLVLYLFHKIVPGIYKNDFIKARYVQREKMAGTEPGMASIERFQDVLEAAIGEEETVKLPPLLCIRPIWEYKTAPLPLL